MLTASFQVKGTPLAEIAARVCQPASDADAERLCIYAYSGSEPAHVRIPEDLLSGTVLLWGLEPHRMRIGPVLGPESDSCLECLSYWLEHNRPDQALWRILPMPEPYNPAHFFWMPLHYKMMEAVSTAFLAGDTRRAFVDIHVNQLSVEPHRYPPAPTCSRCSPRRADGPELVSAPARYVRKTAPGNYRARDLPPAARLRDLYVDYRCGLVRHMYRELNSAMLPMWGAEIKLPRKGLSEIGFGRQVSAHTAESVAILEGLERYCGFTPGARLTTVRGSFAGLCMAGEPVIDPRSFLLCDASQAQEPGYELAAFHENLTMDWIWAYSCRKSGPVLVPQQFCFFGGPFPAKEHFVLETSSGCALGGSLEEAAFYGLLELVERDAYLTRWYLQAPSRRIDLNDPSMPQVQRLYARAVAEGYELSAFSIDLEIPIPTVLAMIIDPTEDAGVATYCASAVHPRGPEAVMGALVEVCSSIGIYKEQFARERGRARALWQDSSLVQEMRDHVLLYSLPEGRERLRHLDASAEAVSAASLFKVLEEPWTSLNLAQDLERLVDAVCRVAEDVLIVDQTTSLLDPLGMRCVKVLAPGLLPVTFGHQYRRIGHRRLDRGREYLQGKGDVCGTAINPFPHNFP